MNRSIRMLVIDDEPTCNFKICSILEQYCHEVFSAKDGLEGWQLYLEHLPNAVITDINMPMISGTELVKKIRKIDKDCFITLMTAYSDEQHIEEIANLQINNYFVKPMNVSEFDLLLRKIDSHRQKQMDHFIVISDALTYDSYAKIIKTPTSTITINNREITVLETLIENLNKVVTYDTFSYALSDSEMTSDNALRLVISRLRKKIAGIPIHSISKVGYILKS